MPTNLQLEPLCEDCRDIIVAENMNYPNDVMDVIELDDDGECSEVANLTEDTDPTLGNPVESFIITEIDDEVETAASKVVWICQICSKTFNFESTLRLHVRDHHKEIQAKKSVPKVSRPHFYSCDQCDEKFRLKYDLRKHSCYRKKSNVASD